jgi:PhnB protein
MGTVMKVESYLFFNGRTEEAIEFYKKAVGAKPGMLMRFKESPEPSQSPLPPGWGEKVMHSSFTIGETMVMASDAMGGGPAEFKGFSLTISTASEAEAKKVFAALSAGGQVHQPLIKTFFSPAFGMLADKFGVGWMIMTEPEKKS